MGIQLQGARLLSLIAILAAPVTASAQAENLLKVYDGANGEITFVDINSIQVVGTSKRYWVVTKLPAPDKYRVVLQRTYMEVDCNARMRAQRAFVDYDAQGTVVYSDSSLDKPAQWRPIVPNSNGDIVRLIVCNR